MSSRIEFPPPRPQMYSMAEVARFVGRSYAHVRRLYSVGIPPEPRHSKKHGEYRERRWTKEEVISLNRWFKSVERGSLMIQEHIKKHKPRKLLKR